jgi:hypothetical protein
VNAKGKKNARGALIFVKKSLWPQSSGSGQPNTS